MRGASKTLFLPCSFFFGLNHEMSKHQPFKTSSISVYLPCPVNSKFTRERSFYLNQDFAVNLNDPPGEMEM